MGLLAFVISTLLSFQTFYFVHLIILGCVCSILQVSCAKDTRDTNLLDTLLELYGNKRCLGVM